MKHQSSRIARRRFLKELGGAAIAAPFFVRNLISAPPSGRVRHASFGANGMAFSDLNNFLAHPNVDLVCVADVDTLRFSRLKEKLAKDKVPADKVKFYQDWRELLDKEGKNLDTVNIGTPDHMHASIAMSAMQLGLHTYIQKPLARTIHEVRQLAAQAKQRKLITQMGIQCHSSAYYRMAVEVLRSGVIGKIKEVHAWTDRKWGDLSDARVPEKTAPVPEGFNWDWWLGVAAARPFVDKDAEGKAYYHPGAWRKRTDFGTGSLGDMGCHIFDPLFEALELTMPLSVRSEGPAASVYNWALHENIQYVFPGTKYTEGKTLNFTWYDGDARPPKDVLGLLGDVKRPASGSILIGTKGVLLQPHHSLGVLLPKPQFAEYKLPKVAGNNHWAQFIDAVLGKDKCSAPLEYSAPLTEMVLLGTISTFFPKTTLEWDGPAAKFKNVPAANAHLTRSYRKGWEVKGLEC